MGPEGDPEALKQAFFEQWPALQGKQYLLYLGRIHPKKGCDLLLEAFAKVAAPELQLVMAGPDETGWSAELKAMAERLGIANRITWTGMLRGGREVGRVLTPRRPSSCPRTRRTSASQSPTRWPAAPFRSSPTKSTSLPMSQPMARD